MDAGLLGPGWLASAVFASDRACRELKMSDVVQRGRANFGSMLKSPRIDRLDWDDWNRAHIRKHAVVPEEAEEAVGGNAMIRVTYSQKLQYIGPTSEGRMLSVVVGSVPGRPFVSYVFSARPASRKERALYAQAKGG